MPNSSTQTVQGTAYSTSSAAFSTKSDEAKILSYMWYIHVTVRVNAADRVWDRLVHLLGQGTPTTSTTTSTTPISPPYSPQFDLDGTNSAGNGSGSGSENSSTLGPEGGGAGAASKIDNLTDYLVLQIFSRPMLETLVNTAPVEEHTDGYARVLAGVPAHFREEFCRRLYCLLFSKYILEWPPGIAVPEPAPGSIAAAADTTDTSAAASSTRPQATTASTISEAAVFDGTGSFVQTPEEKKEVDEDNKDEFMFDMDEILTDDAEYDDIFDAENYMHPVSPEPTSPGCQSTLGPCSPWPDTPELGYSPELARAAYLGTVSAPLPIHYLGDWARSSSSRDDGPARAAYASAAASAAGRQGGSGAGAGASHDERLPPPSWNNRRHPAPAAPPHNTTTPQDRPASLLQGSAHSRDHQQQQRVSHTGSCCPCRVREAWSHGAVGQR